MAVAQIPQPQTGQGAFGAVPGSLQLPNPFGDLSSVYPNLGQSNATASGDILSKLGGTLSPSTQNALQTAAAQFGVGSGMPGSNLSWNSLYGNIAGASEQQQQQGIQDLNATLPVTSGTQTVSPALQTEIATQNSLNAAAPDPTAAASYAEQLYNKYLGQIRGPAGGVTNRPFGGEDLLNPYGGSTAGFGGASAMPSTPAMTNGVPVSSDFFNSGVSSFDNPSFDLPGNLDGIDYGSLDTSGFV